MNDTKLLFNLLTLGSLLVAAVAVAAPKFQPIVEIFMPNVDPAFTPDHIEALRNSARGTFGSGSKLVSIAALVVA